MFAFVYFVVSSRVVCMAVCVSFPPEPFPPDKINYLIDSCFFCGCVDFYSQVPAFVYSKSHIPEDRWGTVYDGLMHVTDWLPTLATAAGITLEGG